MKRLLITLIILFSLYYGIEAIYMIRSSGYNNDYVITNDNKTYQIKEVYIANQSSEHDNYYITINYNNVTYSLETYKDYKKSSKIIKNVYSYNNCIYPTFKDDESYFDIVCMYNGVQEYYHDIKGQDSGLDAFATSLSSVGYNVAKWENKGELSQLDKIVSYNANNLVTGHYFALVNYKGLYTINSDLPNKIYRVSLFTQDVYEPIISGFNNNYYVIANYDEGKTYKDVFVVDIKNNNIKTATTTNEISTNSYIQGTVDNSVYLLDLDNSQQYEVNTKDKTIVEVGNNTTKFKYYDGTNWSYISLADSISKKYFVSNSLSTTSDGTYARIDTIGGSKSGFRYYYQYINGVYKCYRENIQDNTKTYIFDTTSIDRLYYIDDYVYFINGTNINYYNDNTGVKTILSDSEIGFNKYIKFYIYE